MHPQHTDMSDFCKGSTISVLMSCAAHVKEWLSIRQIQQCIRGHMKGWNSKAKRRSLPPYLACYPHGSRDRARISYGSVISACEKGEEWPLAIALLAELDERRLMHKTRLPKLIWPVVRILFFLVPVGFAVWALSLYVEYMGKCIMTPDQRGHIKDLWPGFQTTRLALFRRFGIAFYLVAAS